MKEIILASSSPRRREIFNRFGIKTIIKKPKIKEIFRNTEGPYESVMALAFEKAKTIADNEKSGIIISADTIVVKDNKILNKPKNRTEARKMLKELSNDVHSVITGFCIYESGTNNKVIDFVETKVRFKDLSTEKIERYLDTEEYKDKAGAYGIQGYGQLLIREIKGSYLNVVGLPIEIIDDILEEYFNITIM